VSIDKNNSSKSATATIELAVAGNVLKIDLTVPTEPVKSRRMLPLFRSLADTIVNIASKSAEEEGLKISCKKGCGACCRQLVPITEIESYQILSMVEEMPEPRRTIILERFAEARQKLKERGLLEKLLDPEKFSNEELQPMGIEYFHLGIACPFLEEESCSIHLERPIACREYLVTSPAENCSNPSPEKVRCVKIPSKVSTAVSRINENPEARFIRWVPLIIAPEWAKSHAEEERFPLQPATEIISELFNRLTNRSNT
jgi:Fe-S-cluster containining protein